MMGRVLGSVGSMRLMPGLLPCRRSEGLSQDSSHGLDHLPLQIGRQVVPVEHFYDHTPIRLWGRGGPRRIRASNMEVLRGSGHAACDTTGPDPIAPTSLR